MFLVRESNNAKIGSAAATYAPIKATCPTSCPLRDKGCYAQGGNVGMNVRRLERDYADLNGDTLAVLEAAEIRDASPHSNLPLRLHVSGDATTPFRARTLSDACAAWKAPVWAYTHAWRDVERANWGSVSVLASCETLDSAKQALASGYAAALVTPPHAKDGKAYTVDGVKVIPCPSQTRGVKCTDCKLCFDDRALLARNAVIAFEVHGASKKRALTVLT